MSTHAIKNAVRAIVNNIAKQEYQLVIDNSISSRLTAIELDLAVREHGLHPAPPPNASDDLINSVQVVSEHVPTWSVYVPLWDRNGTMSDLTLELTVHISNNDITYEIDNLHVL